MKPTRDAADQPQPVPLPRGARLRLGLTALVLLVWLGFLAWLAVTTRNPVVLSRPQLLLATVDVIADVTAEADGRPRSQVTVVEVAWPPDHAAALQGKEIEVVNLPEVTAGHGWGGPGRYLLPLMRHGNDYLVAPTPPSPGFNTDPRANPAARPHIYPDTPDTRQQHDQARSGR